MDTYHMVKECSLLRMEKLFQVTGSKESYKAAKKRFKMKSKIGKKDKLKSKRKQQMNAIIKERLGFKTDQMELLTNPILGLQLSL